MTASDGAVDKHLATDVTAETRRSLAEAVKDQSEDTKSQSEAAEGQTKGAKGQSEVAEGHAETVKGQPEQAEGKAEAGVVSGVEGAASVDSKDRGHPRAKEPMSLKDEAKLDIESEEMERKSSSGTGEGTTSEHHPGEANADKSSDEQSSEAAGGTCTSPVPQDYKDMTKTNSIEEEVVDYDVSDSEEDLSVKTVESVDVSHKSSETKTKAAKEQRQKSKSRERSASKGGHRDGPRSL